MAILYVQTRPSFFGFDSEGFLNFPGKIFSQATFTFFNSGFLDSVSPVKHVENIYFYGSLDIYTTRKLSVVRRFYFATTAAELEKAKVQVSFGVYFNGSGISEEIPRAIQKIARPYFGTKYRKIKRDIQSFISIKMATTTSFDGGDGNGGNGTGDETICNSKSWVYTVN
jgi:hypothetical protein